MDALAASRAKFSLPFRMCQNPATSYRTGPSQRMPSAVSAASRAMPQVTQFTE